MSGHRVVADHDQGASAATGPVHDEAAIGKLRRDVIAGHAPPGQDPLLAGNRVQERRLHASDRVEAAAEGDR